ncbi:MAG: hypothetical protein SEPTF4163_003841 [Sporothrix epigloea]
MARFVRKYHPHYAALEIWTSPVTDVQAIINWLHGVCPAPQQLNRCRPHHNNPIYCQRCRTKHTWNQHVPPPPPYKRDGQQYKGRAIQRPKASGVAAPTTSESDDGMCGPLVNLMDKSGRPGRNLTASAQNTADVSVEVTMAKNSFQNTAEYRMALRSLVARTEMMDASRLSGTLKN